MAFPLSNTKVSFFGQEFYTRDCPQLLSTMHLYNFFKKCKLSTSRSLWPLPFPSFCVFCAVSFLGENRLRQTAGDHVISIWGHVWGFQRGFRTRRGGFSSHLPERIERPLWVWPRKYVTIVLSKLLNTCLGVYLRQRMSMYLFVVELKRALLLSANSIWQPPQVKTRCCTTLLSMGFSAMKKSLLS